MDANLKTAFIVGKTLSTSDGWFCVQGDSSMFISPLGKIEKIPDGITPVIDGTSVKRLMQGSFSKIKVNEETFDDDDYSKPIVVEVEKLVFSFEKDTANYYAVFGAEYISQEEITERFTSISKKMEVLNDDYIADLYLDEKYERVLIIKVS